MGRAWRVRGAKPPGKNLHFAREEQEYLIKKNFFSMIHTNTVVITILVVFEVIIGCVMNLVWMRYLGLFKRCCLEYMRKKM
jgi:hypothetical protein